MIAAMPHACRRLPHWLMKVRPSGVRRTLRSPTMLRWSLQKRCSCCRASRRTALHAGGKVGQDRAAAWGIPDVTLLLTPVWVPPRLAPALCTRNRTNRYAESICASAASAGVPGRARPCMRKAVSDTTQAAAAAVLQAQHQVA